MLQISKTFCAYPWDHLATLTNGDIIPCCVAKSSGELNLKDTSFQQAWNSKQFKKIRKKMLVGEPVESCTLCYQQEKTGAQSRRQQYNTYIEKKLGSFSSFVSNTDNQGHFNGEIRSIDLRLSNNCNLQCVMCKPAESTLWAKNIHDLMSHVTNLTVRNDLSWKSRIDLSQYDWAKSPAFWDSLKNLISQLSEITIAGGEPFLIQENLNFLQFCADNGLAKNLKIRFHTNGTVLPQHLLKVLETFKEVEMIVSLDSIGEQNFYLRYPARWTAIMRNLELLDSSPKNMNVFLLTSLSVLNIYYYPDFLDWYISNKFKKVAKSSSFFNLPNFGFVHEPSYLCIKNLPTNLKEKIVRKFNNFYEVSLRKYYQDSPENFELAVVALNGVLSFMNEDNKEADHSILKNYLYALDKSRKTDFVSVFPELSQLMD